MELIRHVRSGGFRETEPQEVGKPKYSLEGLGAKLSLIDQDDAFYRICLK